MMSSRVERAHAQKNYVTAIIAISRIVSPELSEKSRARVSRLENYAREMLELIDLDLRQTSRSRCNVDELLRASCDVVRDRAEEAQVAIAVQSRGGHLYGDPARIREALANLLANALEASSVGKTIYVDAEVSAAGDHVWTIRDYGVGMPPALLGQLGSPVRSTRRGGSGVGIAIASSIVREHGGSIHFDSRIGRGTIVSIMLPRAGLD